MTKQQPKQNYWLSFQIRPFLDGFDKSVLKAKQTKVNFFLLHEY